MPLSEIFLPSVSESVFWIFKAIRVEDGHDDTATLAGGHGAFSRDRSPPSRGWGRGANMGCPGPWAPPTASGLCVGPPPASGLPAPVWHPSSIAGLFQTCPLYGEPLAQRVAAPFSWQDSSWVVRLVWSGRWGGTTPGCALSPCLCCCRSCQQGLAGPLSGECQCGAGMGGERPWGGFPG